MEDARRKSVVFVLRQVHGGRAEVVGTGFIYAVDMPNEPASYWMYAITDLMALPEVVESRT